VDLLWLYDGYAPSHARQRLLPMGTVELVVNLRQDQPAFRRHLQLLQALRQERRYVLCLPSSGDVVT
jgi:hypothetical protein